MILLTGITGNIGGATARALLGKGIKFRALVRDLSKAAPWAAQGVELVQGDLNNAASVASALQGIDRAFLVLPNGEDQEHLELNFIETAKTAGLPWIIKLSSPEAVRGTTSAIPLAHIAAEDAIKASGMNWTFVRPSFFMQKLRGAALQAKATGKLAMPMGKGNAALTDCEDAGTFIAHLLTDANPEQHYGQCYEITGPDKVMTFAEIAEVIADVMGKEVVYVDCDAKAYQQAIRPYMSSDWHSDAVAQLFAEIADGTTPGTKTDTFRKITGLQGTSFREYLQKIA